MSERIAIVGGGGREDALARRLFQDGAELISIMPNDNPSIRSISSESLVTTSMDTDMITRYIMDRKPDLVYVSPDGYLETNLVDKLEYNKIKVASPTSASFQIESSKIFMRQLMKRYGIPGNLKYEVLDNEYDIQKLLSNTSLDFAIKPSGLTGGKGVKITDQHFNSRSEAIGYALEVFRRDKKVLIEEAVYGEEFSMQLFTDGLAANSLNLSSNLTSIRSLGFKNGRNYIILAIGVLTVSMGFIFYNTFSSYFEGFLYVLDYWITPWIGVMIAEFFLVKKKESFSSNINWNPIIAYLLSIIISIPFMDTIQYYFGIYIPFYSATSGVDFSYVISFFISIILTYIFETKISGKLRQSITQIRTVKDSGE